MKRLLARAVLAVSVGTRIVVGKSAGLIQPGALHARPNNGLGDPSDRRDLPCVSRYPNRLTGIRCRSLLYNRALARA
jgi:hypothetical protein